MARSARLGITRGLSSSATGRPLALGPCPLGAAGGGSREGLGHHRVSDVDGTIALAPSYDFGPAYLDARAIARVIRWDTEAPGGASWRNVCVRLDIRFEEAERLPSCAWFAAAAPQTVPQLRTLPDLLRECGADEDVVARRRPEIDRLIAALAELGG